MIFLWSFLTSFVLSVILVPIFAWLAGRFGLVDDPKKHKHPGVIHQRIIPRAGGAAIFLAFFLTTFLMVPLSKKIMGILAGGLLLTVVGLIDDKIEINKWLRLLLQIVAALVVIGGGVGIAYITNPLAVFSGVADGAGNVIRLDILRVSFDFLGRHSILVWADLFALFWIVWVINMVNFSSGVDGQMPGIVFIVLLVIFVAALRFYPADYEQLIVSRLALAGAGATLGFLIFNFYPAKIFPGDSGSYFLGFLIATLAILSGAKVGTAILVMAVPLVDGAFTIIRRVAAGKSPLAADRRHLHHRLLSMGWGQRRIALFYWLLCAILGAIALTLHSEQKIFAGVVVVIVILGGLVWLAINLPAGDQR